MRNITNQKNHVNTPRKMSLTAIQVTYTAGKYKFVSMTYMGSYMTVQPGHPSLAKHFLITLRCPRLPLEPPTHRPSYFVWLGVAEGQVCLCGWNRRLLSADADLRGSGVLPPRGRGFQQSGVGPHQEADTESWLCWKEGTRWPLSASPTPSLCNSKKPQGQMDVLQVLPVFSGFFHMQRKLQCAHTVRNTSRSDGRQQRQPTRVPGSS